MAGTQTTFSVAEVKPQTPLKIGSGFWVQGLPGGGPLAPGGWIPGPGGWRGGPGRLVAQFRCFGIKNGFRTPWGASPGASAEAPAWSVWQSLCAAPAGKGDVRQGSAAKRRPQKLEPKRWPRGYFKKRGGTPGFARTRNEKC